MALAEKEIHDLVPHHVHLFKGEHLSPEYLKLKPKGVVPTLVRDGHVIRESALIVASLSFVSVFRERMLAMDPDQRAGHWPPATGSRSLTAAI